MTDNVHSDEISTLNTLIATTIDSVTGYENSAKDIDNQRFAQIFRERASERQQVVEELRNEVRRLSHTPAMPKTTALSSARPISASRTSRRPSQARMKSRSSTRSSAARII